MKTINRRRKEHKTDYNKRIKLLKSRIPRVTFRKTNKYIIGQYITSKEAQDKVILEIRSNKLKKFGWPNEFENSLKSLPASYLTGFLIGKTISKEKLETPIIDTGMTRMIPGNKAYAFILGIIDSGIILSKKNIPRNEERIKGKFLKKDFSKEFDSIKLKIEKL